MLKKHPNHVLVNCVVAIKPQIGFPLKLADAGTAIEPLMEKPNWSYVNNHNGIIFPEPEKHSLYFISFNHITVQTLGLEHWTHDLERYINLIVTTLAKFGVTTVEKVGVKFIGFLNLRMTHPELCEAMFGTYLVEKAEIEKALPKVDDLLLKFWGQEGSANYECSIVPQTAEQATISFYTWPNLDLFNDRKSRNPVPATFWEGKAKAALNVEVELSKKEQSPGDVSRFLRTVTDVADGLVTRAVNRLLYLPIK